MGTKVLLTGDPQKFDILVRLADLSLDERATAEGFERETTDCQDVAYAGRLRALAAAHRNFQIKVAAILAEGLAAAVPADEVGRDLLDSAAGVIEQRHGRKCWDRSAEFRRPAPAPEPDVMDAYLADGWEIDGRGRWHKPAGAVTA